jgi:hypothetical protein
MRLEAQRPAQIFDSGNASKDRTACHGWPDKVRSLALIRSQTKAEYRQPAAEVVREGEKDNK